MRNKSIFTLILLFYSFGIFSQIPTNGLVAWYPFNGNANDLSGNGNNGIVTGATPTTDRFGNPNKAYSFNGSNYILVPNNTTLNPSNFVTISAWVQTTNSHINAGIVGKWNSAGISGYTQYVLVANSQGATAAVKANYQTTISENGVTYNNGNWHHYCVTYNGSTVKLYRDGLLTNSSTLTGTMSGFVQNFEIGRYSGGAYYYEYFTGKIDDIRIYNRDLNISEINALYNENKSPIITINLSNQSFCEESNSSLGITITNTSIVNYLWQKNGINISNSNSNVLNFNNVQLSDSGFYRCIAYNIYGADTSIVSKVTIKPKPIANFTGLAPNYCYNSTNVILTGSHTGGVFSGNGVVGTNFSPNNAGAGNHYITFTATVNGCSDTAMQSVTVYTVPNVVLSGLAYNYCKNAAPITMVGSPGGGTFSGIGVSGSTFNPGSINQGNHIISYTFTDAYGCSAQDTHWVKVSNVPIANAGNNQLIIPGSSITLLGSGSNGSGMYSYFWTPSDSFYYASVQNATTKPLHSFNQFILTVTDLSTNCIGKDTVNVGMSTIPTQSLVSTNQAVICQGSTTLLNTTTNGGAGIYTYNWTSIPVGFASNLANPVVKPNITTKYYLTTSDGFTSDYDSILITVNPLFVINLGPDTILCGNTTHNLDAGAGANNYVWSTGAISQSVNINTINMTSGMYQYIATATHTNGCISKDTINIKVSHIAKVNLGNDTGLCVGNNIVLDAGTGYSSYSWQNGNGTQQTYTTINPWPCGPINFHVKVTNIDGCVDRDTILIEYYCKPNVFLGPDTLVCGVGNLVLNGGNAGAQDPYTYIWNTGNNGQYQLINGSNYTPGIHNVSVMVTSSHGCISQDSINITFSPIQDIDLGIDTFICKTQVLNLNAGTGYQSYVWSTGANSQNIVIDSLLGIGVPHLIHVRANDTYGCWAMDTIVVTINPCLDIEDIGNNDEIRIFPNPSNGIFYIQAENIESLEILDVNGKLIKRINTLNSQNDVVKIDLGKVGKGIYLLKLTQANSISTKKIIIQ